MSTAARYPNRSSLGRTSSIVRSDSPIAKTVALLALVISSSRMNSLSLSIKWLLDTSSSRNLKDLVLIFRIWLFWSRFSTASMSFSECFTAKKSCRISSIPGELCFLALLAISQLQWKTRTLSLNLGVLVSTLGECFHFATFNANGKITI